MIFEVVRSIRVNNHKRIDKMKTIMKRKNKKESRIHNKFVFF